MTSETISHYRTLKKLGAGGMGEVYLAQDTSELERTVALKFLPAELASDQKRLQRFVQEAKTVSALNSRALPEPNGIDIILAMRDDFTEKDYGLPEHDQAFSPMPSGFASRGKT